MSSRKDYFRAVDEIVEYCKNNTHRENLIAIYLAGSVARGDFSPGRSDIDIYLVLKDRNQEFEEELANKAKAPLDKGRVSNTLGFVQEVCGRIMQGLWSG